MISPPLQPSPVKAPSPGLERPPVRFAFIPMGVVADHIPVYLMVEPERVLMPPKGASR